MAEVRTVPGERVSVTELRRHLRRYLEQVYFGRQPLVVRRHHEEVVIMLRLDEYQALMARPASRGAAEPGKQRR